MYLLSSIVYCLQCIIECAKLAKVLDDDDLVLLKLAFCPWQNCCARLCAFIQVAIFAWISILLLLTLFDISIFLCGLFIVVLIPFIALFLPFCVFKLGFAVVDNRFQTFLSVLRRRECSLFGVNNGGRNQLILPLKNVRRQCLLMMRECIAQFVLASKEIVSLKKTLNVSKSIDETSVDSSNLILEFANDELRLLISGDDAEIEEELLQVSSLRTCWQFLFLVRSEFFRLSIVSLLELDESKATVESVLSLATWRNRIKVLLGICSLFIQSIVKAICLFDASKFDVSIAKKRRYLPLTNFSHDRALTPLDSAIFQLEWVLENLYKETQLPRVELSQNLIASLQSVVSTLSNPPTVDLLANPTFENNHLIDKSNFVEEENNVDKNRSVYAENLIDSNRNNDFQIFEMYTGKTENFAQPLEKVDDDAKTISVIDRRPLLRELHSAISFRKEICIKREMAALAKLRKVPVEEIRRDELERHEFILPLSQGIECPLKDEKLVIEKMKNNSRFLPVSHGALGRMPNANELAEIIRERQKFTSVVAAGDCFSFSDDEDKVAVEDVK